MRRIFTHLCVVFSLLAGAPLAQAKVLVYRVKRFSNWSIDRNGKTGSEPWDSSVSLLAVFDLDTDFVSVTDTDSTKTENIFVNDKTLSFTHQFVGEPGGKGHRSQTKFEFFNNSKSFYVFNQDFENFGWGGTDHGAFFATGSCTLNVDIGWVDSTTKLNIKSAVPKNFIATQYRGDGGEFKRNVWGMTYDATITKAVNAYLSALDIKSVKGDEVSLAIPAAKEWLIKTYLPKKYPK
jgi:hypothetical protein